MGEMQDRNSLNDTNAEDCAVIWMGNHSRLMELASPHFAVYHVSHSQALLRALQHGLAYCVVLDSAPDDTE
ncbi:MAG: hypothetical protein EHM39_01190, partial [Chloroflexi bacterium]